MMFLLKQVLIFWYGRPFQQNILLVFVYSFLQIAQANAGNDEDQAQDETLDENPEEMDIESPPEETDESNIPGQVDGEEDEEVPKAEETDQNEEHVEETANEEEINDNDTGADDMQDENLSYKINRII